jgi:hypothetical protein
VLVIEQRVVEIEQHDPQGVPSAHILIIEAGIGGRIYLAW